MSNRKFPHPRPRHNGSGLANPKRLPSRQLASVRLRVPTPPRVARDMARDELDRKKPARGVPRITSTAPTKRTPAIGDPKGRAIRPGEHALETPPRAIVFAIDRESHRLGVANSSSRKNMAGSKIYEPPKPPTDWQHPVRKNKPLVSLCSSHRFARSFPEILGRTTSATTADARLPSKKGRFPHTRCLYTDPTQAGRAPKPAGFLWKSANAKTIKIANFDNLDTAPLVVRWARGD